MSKTEKQQKYADIIKEIGDCYSVMKSVRPLSAGELAYFNREFSISASHNSNAIEGNTFTFDETKLLIEKGIVTGYRRIYKTAARICFAWRRRSRQIQNDSKLCRQLDENRFYSLSAVSSAWQNDGIR